MHTVSVVGVGRVGGALAIALSRAGYSIESLVHRGSSNVEQVVALLADRPTVATLDSLKSINSDVVLICTADPEITAVSDAAARIVRHDSVILHTSGSLSSDVLGNLSALGCSTGSIHPLVSITDPITGADGFEGIFTCIEGAQRAVATAVQLSRSLGAKPFSIPTNRKPLYHAAAVMACGHLVALVDVALEMLTKCGVVEDQAKEVLLPLIRSTIANLETRTPEQALTGSFARADSDAISRHLAAIEEEGSDEVLRIYVALGERSIELATRNGLEPSALEKLAKTISVAKRNTGC